MFERRLLHHHAPMAEPATLARIPSVRLLTMTSVPEQSNTYANSKEAIECRGAFEIIEGAQLDKGSARPDALPQFAELRALK